MLLASLALVATAADAPLPLDRARNVLEEARLACVEDGGALWGISLCGPLVLVDPESRFAVANEADGAGVLKAEGGVFAGVLPSDVVVANTATRWSGRLWTMVMWPSIGPRPVQQRRLLMHESFHRIQADLGLPAANANNPHLDSLEGRYWFLLELRALAAALRAPEAGPAIRDALAFRARRQSLFEGAAALERALENNEGLAEYTGYALRGTAAAETRLTLARRLEDVDREASFVRGFAYSTGPAYGLLLDTADAGWRRSYKASSDLAATLAAAAKLSPAEDPEARARSYDGGSLRASEEERARLQAARVAEYRARLVDGPVLAIPLEAAQYGFDPNSVVALGDAGTVYPSLEVYRPLGNDRHRCRSARRRGARAAARLGSRSHTAEAQPGMAAEAGSAAGRPAAVGVPVNGGFEYRERLGREAERLDRARVAGPEAPPFRRARLARPDRRGRGEPRRGDRGGRRGAAGRPVPRLETPALGGAGGPARLRDPVPRRRTCSRSPSRAVCPASRTAAFWSTRCSTRCAASIRRPCRCTGWGAAPRACCSSRGRTRRGVRSRRSGGRAAC